MSKKQETTRTRTPKSTHPELKKLIAAKKKAIRDKRYRKEKKNYPYKKAKIGLRAKENTIRLLEKKMEYLTERKNHYKELFLEN